MVLTVDLDPSLTETIFRASRSLIRKLPSFSGTSPHGASRSEAISRARGSPRDCTVLGDGLVGRGLTESELDGGAELAGVGPAVRVSGLGSLAALVQPVTKQSAPQTARRLERRTRCLISIGVAVTLTVWPGESRQLLRPQI
jgi:hypothetical protein